MKDQLVLRVTAKLLIPFILLYAFYIQLHGEYSPGGGFQAGVIGAAAFILYSFIFGNEAAKNVISTDTIKVLAAFGVLIYGGVGVVALLMGGEFLNYTVLWSDQKTAQKIGIVIIELGVGLTVFAVMMGIWHAFAEFKLKR